jgi:hypothetical protein
MPMSGRMAQSPFPVKRIAGHVHPAESRERAGEMIAL